MMLMCSRDANRHGRLRPDDFVSHAAQTPGMLYIVSSTSRCGSCLTHFVCRLTFLCLQHADNKTRHLVCWSFTLSFLLHSTCQSSQNLPEGPHALPLLHTLHLHFAEPMQCSWASQRPTADPASLTLLSLSVHSTGRGLEGVVQGPVLLLTQLRNLILEAVRGADMQPCWRLHPPCLLEGLQPHMLLSSEVANPACSRDAPESWHSVDASERRGVNKAVGAAHAQPCWCQQHRLAAPAQGGGRLL